ncbi:Dna polymerase kappa [Thalictrum thalictroides]|uniref:Dna polymerase kappa n=1 Tax=Thalictrum thalictroides TaxID=46969 RepID=A0A7J6V838_THATH|nr:Dna polymerase kappa [Thalictrum thalictroides]
MSDSKDREEESRLLQSYHTIFTNAKAGIDGVDKEKVQKEAKDQNLLIFEERREAFIKQKIEKMRAECGKLTAVDISHYQKARKFGVRAAMSGFVARKLCPELIIVPVDFKKFSSLSYGDCLLFVFAKIASEFRAGVFEETGLTCSAGVAPNRMLAKDWLSHQTISISFLFRIIAFFSCRKVCSDINKPNGHFVLRNDRIAVMAFISALPIWKIGGIGKVTEHILRDVLGISTCEEILHKSAYLCALFSHSLIDFFLSAALGLGKTHTPEVRSWKSSSSERTFSATADEVSLYNNIECKWWNDTKERSSQKPGGNQMDVKDVNKRDERIQAGGDKNNVWHHDCFHELEANALPTTRKRPAFGEKRIEQESGNSAEMTATVSGRPTSIEQPASENARRKEWGEHNLYGNKLTNHLEKIEYHHTGEKHKGLAFLQ